MEELIVGDQVQLKSGGPVMTIVDLPESDTGRITCQWFAENDFTKTYTEPFPAEVLLKVVEVAPDPE